jgi:SAM-dependent methyltransferase
MPGPSLTFLVVIALVRVVGRALDGALLLRRPRLWRLWWRGLSAPPSPWRMGFAAVMTARQAGVPVDDLVYGETFVVAARALLRSHGIGPGAVVVDLGCGRGGVLVAAASLGASARGIDVLPAHVEAIGAAASRAGVAVDVGDARHIADAVIADADVVWLSWVTWSSATRTAVTARLRAMKPGALVVGVAHGVDDDAFMEVERCRAWSTWGRADLVICRRR